MAIIYFLQSDIIPTLLEAGVEVVLLTDDDLCENIAQKFARPGLTIAGLRLKQANDYYRKVDNRRQWLLAYLRRVSSSWRINIEAQTSHIWEVWGENSWKFRLGVWLPAALATLVLRSSSAARKALVRAQMRFTPNIYTDLFEKYQPDLVIASTPGWRIDRYLLREAAARGVPTMTVIVGWDNPSSYAIPGAPVDWASCWSQVQKDELVRGSDWRPERVNIGGIPSYDGYFRKSWLMPRDAYFRLHGLDPARKLISYACSFVHFAPNYPNVEALARLVSSDELAQPSQLLVRLHPSHFQDQPRIFADEREAIHALEQKYPHVHVVRPVALGGSLGYYGGEDMDEKSSMMAHHGGRDGCARHAHRQRLYRRAGRLEHPGQVFAVAARDRQLAHAQTFPRCKGRARGVQSEPAVRGPECLSAEPAAGCGRTQFLCRARNHVY